MLHPKLKEGINYEIGSEEFKKWWDSLDIDLKLAFLMLTIKR